MTRQSETEFATNLVTKYGQQCAELFALFLHTIPLGCSWAFLHPQQVEDLGLPCNPEGPVPLIWDPQHKAVTIRTATNANASTLTFVLIPVVGGFILETAYSVAVNVIEQCGGFYDEDMLTTAGESRTKAKEMFAKRLEKAISESGELRFGYYCVNGSQTITMNGVAYPAYSLPLRAIAEIAAQQGLSFRVPQHAPILASTVAASPWDTLSRSVAAPSGNAILGALTH
jgi:hypothetical protein